MKSKPIVNTMNELQLPSGENDDEGKLNERGI
jgi:hypothetical protein